MEARRSVSSGSSGATGTLFRSLLVPIDLTPNSDRVLGRLARLPLAKDARVSLLHVVPDDFTLQEQRSATRDAHKALAEEVRQLRRQLPDSVHVDALVRVGGAATEIAECAHRVKAKLIVLGRGGGRVLREAFLGSTAERVIRGAQLPVLTVRLPPRAAYVRPALALDFEPPPHEVVRVMLQLLPTPRPVVDVIHAFHVPYRGMSYPSVSARDAERRTGELRSDAKAQLTKLLSAALEKAKVRHDAPRFRTHLGQGSPRHVVERVTKREDTDLLVLGTHGHTNIAYWLLGTVAGELLRSAKCDVLVVPPVSSTRGR